MATEKKPKPLLKPNDRWLRKNGFKIEQRPAVGPNIWSLLGQKFTEQEALHWCEETKK